MEKEMEGAKEIEFVIQIDSLASKSTIDKTGERDGKHA